MGYSLVELGIKKPSWLLKRLLVDNVGRVNLTPCWPPTHHCGGKIQLFCILTFLMDLCEIKVKEKNNLGISVGKKKDSWIMDFILVFFFGPHSSPRVWNSHQDLGGAVQGEEGGSDSQETNSVSLTQEEREIPGSDELRQGWQISAMSAAVTTSLLSAAPHQGWNSLHAGRGGGEN